MPYKGANIEELAQIPNDIVATTITPSQIPRDSNLMGNTILHLDKV